MSHAKASSEPTRSSATRAASSGWSVNALAILPMVRSACKSLTPQHYRKPSIVGTLKEGDRLSPPPACAENGATCSTHSPNVLDTGGWAKCSRQSRGGKIAGQTIARIDCRGTAMARLALQLTNEAEAET